MKKKQLISEEVKRMQKIAGILKESINEAEEIKVGSIYTAALPTSSDKKGERIDVKVKVLAQDKDYPDYYVVEPVETVPYENPVSGGKNEFTKGKQYNVEAEHLKLQESATESDEVNEGTSYGANLARANDENVEKLIPVITPHVESALKIALPKIQAELKKIDPDENMSTRDISTALGSIMYKMLG